MEILKNINEIISYRKNTKESVGFVPTMGALHQGHLSLLQKAREQNDTVIASIFVNPTQFLAGEDFEKYPRKLEADIEICERADIDALFLPQADDIYSGYEETTLHAPKTAGYLLEGYHRPGHFDGVLQVVLKLFNLTRPTRAYFGKKDAQQLLLIEQMTRELFLDIEIVPCDTVRDRDGLALSSRNAYLSQDERKLAHLIPDSLEEAFRAIISGKHDAKAIKDEILDELKSLDVQYVEIVNRNLERINRVEKGNTIVLLAVKVGSTRLIDNLWI